MGLLGRIDRTLKLRAALEDHVLTRPAPLFRPAFALDAREEAEAQAAVRAMRETAAFLSGVRVGPERLAAIRAAMADAYDGKRPDLKVRVNPHTGIAQVLSPLLLQPEILALATDRFLCGVVERYLRRRVVLADIDMRRVPPVDMTEIDRRGGPKRLGYTSSHWHRDIRGRQVKIMFYLTDVTQSDSNFAFLPGTHKGYQTRPRPGDARRVGDAWVDGCGLTPVECYGPAGTAMVFDTNFVHRLRRKPGATVRDSVTFYYTPGQETRALGVDHEAVARLPEPARALFAGRRAGAAGVDGDP